MAEAFTAGVKKGGLNDDVQIRILLCYLIQFAGPIAQETIEAALLDEQLVNYFELHDAMTQIEKQGLVTQDEENRYAVTPKGRIVANDLSYDVPRTVRDSALRAVLRIQQWQHKAAANRAAVEMDNGHYVVTCIIGDLGEDIFRLQLLMPDKLTAEAVKNRFIARGSDIYASLLTMLTESSSHQEDEPPESIL